MESLNSLIPPELIPLEKKTKLEEFEKDFEVWREHKCLSPHTEWAWDFLNSEYFKNNNNVSYYKKIFSGVSLKDRFNTLVEHSLPLLDKLVEYEKSIYPPSESNPKEAIINSLPIFTEFFSLYFVADELGCIARWGFNRTYEHNLDEEYKWVSRIEEILEEYIKTKTLNINEDEIYLRGYFSKTLSFCWTLTEAKIGYKILNLIDLCLECDLLVYNKVLPDDFFKDKESSQKIARKRLTLLLLKSFIHYQHDEIEKYKETLRQIIDLHIIYNKERGIFYPVGMNRILESALNLYKVEPTDENKQRVLDFYTANMLVQTADSREYPRERALVTFQIAKTFGYAK